MIIKGGIRENAGYIIVKGEQYSDDHEIVLGRNKYGQWVTWECAYKENNYFWGHYFNEEKHALEDYHRRLMKNYELIPF